MKILIPTFIRSNISIPRENTSEENIWTVYISDMLEELINRLCA